jgi:hypothetical protein
VVAAEVYVGCDTSPPGPLEARAARTLRVVGTSGRVDPGDLDVRQPQRSAHAALDDPAADADADADASAR